MPSPLIGITTYRQTHQEGFTLFSLAEAYVQAVSQAGGFPVLIPLGLPEIQLRGLFSRLDGLLFSGGGDVAPGFFGGEAHPAVDLVDTDRDRVEIELVREAIKHDMPFLGICRGIQVINVALGGTLYTHIPDQLAGAIHHPHIPGNSRGYLAHEVLIQPGSRLSEILGKPRLMVNSMHHQGIAILAPGFEPTVHATDGLIEGMERSNYNFGMAVQWHPEWLTAHAPMQALFRSFVEAVAK
jgi:putative glutamine amidotransferase